MDDEALIRVIVRLENGLHAMEQAYAQMIVERDEATVELADLKAVSKQV